MAVTRPLPEGCTKAVQRLAQSGAIEPRALPCPLWIRVGDDPMDPEQIIVMLAVTGWAHRCDGRWHRTEPNTEAAALNAWAQEPSP